ncbi:MAG: methylmalonyl Co-A mutase-associated GTPase MeaB [Candidatus Marinimicrobia bacterium]|jgi:LAO/AO transport system kinase|nr:methylmalonyl Co-A mutase-associated GTPase MeaB [Candidatus Neomarinimicrobiota bacterium]
MLQSLIHGVRDNDHGSISKAITIIENDQRDAEPLLTEIYPESDGPLRIGVTGPPGAGKSTLTNVLIEKILELDKTVGVVAVDPTSPFSGGSLLGDRIRMNQYPWDERVFVRSMGSHGDLGGLARRSQEVGDVLAASGKDYILYETVGVGQSEHDIVKAADLCIVVLVPESGDEIQMMKAGLIEIADLFVINKSDRDGANRLSSMLRNILHNFSKIGKLEPPVYNTIGTEKVGIDQLFKGIGSHVSSMMDAGHLDDRRLERYRQRVLSLVRGELEDSFWTNSKVELLRRMTESIDQISMVPHAMAKRLLGDSGQ